MKGKDIKRLRKRIGYTQNQLAEAIGFKSKSAISAWENSRRDIALVNSYYNHKIEDFFSQEGVR